MTQATTSSAAERGEHVGGYGSRYTLDARWADRHIRVGFMRQLQERLIGSMRSLWYLE